MLILAFLVLTLLSIAQERSEQTSLSMRWEQNNQWLFSLKAKEKPLQWQMIADRYFRGDTTATEKTDLLYTPLLIVDGLALFITDSTDEAIKRKLLSLLADDKIAEVTVIDKQPEGWIFCKQFTGIILARTNDKKTYRTLKRIKFY